jgi:PucR C-terminal helix-turn-helix domain
MIVSQHSEPWRDLPAAVADVIEPELKAVTGEILDAIARDVPEYRRPLEGSFGRGIQRGVGEALSQFVSLIRDPDAGRGLGRGVYVELGRGELRQGRTLDSLQAAYRVGARVAWRRIAVAARRAKLDSEVLSCLAEAVFAYIDELSADSVEGFAQAQAEVEDQRRRQQRELVELLLREPPVEQADLRAAAQAAGWRVPTRVAALACADGALAGLARALPTETISSRVEAVGCAIVPDPDGPGRSREVARAASARAASLGPTVEPAQLSASWKLAKTALRAAEAGTLPGVGLVRAEDHLAELLLFEGSGLATRIAARRLGAFDALTEKARERMRETALAYVGHGGNAVAMAAAMHLHPQTVRYRVARLRDLLGDQLDDPDTRFELEIALRSTSLPG